MGKRGEGKAIRTAGRVSSLEFGERIHSLDIQNGKGSLNVDCRLRRKIREADRRPERRKAAGKRAKAPSSRKGEKGKKFSEYSGGKKGENHQLSGLGSHITYNLQGESGRKAERKGVPLEREGKKHDPR